MKMKFLYMPAMHGLCLVALRRAEFLIWMIDDLW